MSLPENCQILDEAAVIALGRVRIEYWTAEYDLKSDTFQLTAFWQGYGYGQRIPTTSFAAVVAMFESAARARAAVFYDGQNGVLKWSVGPITV